MRHTDTCRGWDPAAQLCSACGGRAGKEGARLLLNAGERKAVGARGLMRHRKNKMWISWSCRNGGW